MSDIPGACSYREEQIWNRIFRWGRKTVQVEPVYKRNPTIRLVELDANVEEKITFASTTKTFAIKVRGSSRMKIAYIEDATNVGPFWSVGLFGIYREENLNLDQDGAGIDLYVQIDKANTLEIIEWN
jgi:hypothetical protein